jgi:hypothetical protein
MVICLKINNFHHLKDFQSDTSPSPYLAYVILERKCGPIAGWDNPGEPGNRVPRKSLDLEIFGRRHAFLMIYTSERKDFLLYEIISFQWVNFPRE